MDKTHKPIVVDYCAEDNCPVCNDEERPSRCPACGDIMDYCQGHGKSGDFRGWRILVDHWENDEHIDCHPDGCDVKAMEVGDTDHWHGVL